MHLFQEQLHSAVQDLKMTNGEEMNRDLLSLLLNFRKRYWKAITRLLIFKNAKYENSMPRKWSLF